MVKTDAKNQVPDENTAPTSTVQSSPKSLQRTMGIQSRKAGERATLKVQSSSCEYYILDQTKDAALKKIKGKLEQV